jgi:hypothetical protein
LTISVDDNPSEGENEFDITIVVSKQDIGNFLNPDIRGVDFDSKDLKRYQDAMWKAAEEIQKYITKNVEEMIKKNWGDNAYKTVDDFVFFDIKEPHYA